jgi:hypothetical protein
MPRIAEFDGIRMNLYFRDHNPPHVHAVYGEFEALVVIADGSLLSGELPKKQFAAVRRYLASHRDEVMGLWTIGQKG